MNNYAAEAAIGAAALNREATDNPFKLVYRLVDQHATMDKNALFELFQDEIADREEFRRAVDLYFFTNAYSYAAGTRHSKPDPIERAQATAKRGEMVERLKEQIMLLDFPMTNGKLLGDCTGAELSTMSNRYQKLADRVGKTKTVRSVLNEDQVKEIIK